MLKHDLTEQREQQPQSHQFRQQHQQQQQHQGTLATTGGGLLQSTNAAVNHQLTVNPIDDCVSDFSLYENIVNDYSYVTK